MVVKHNMQGMNTNRMLGLNTRAVSGVAEKLSSGYRINRAADDAAGLSISEKMRRQIRGLTQASSNAQDGISLVQTAEGGLNEVHDMIHRMNELSVKAANGTLTEIDREYINQEVQQLKSEINRVADTTTFNEIQLFPSDGSSSIYSEDYEVTLNPDGTYTSTLKNTYTFVKNDSNVTSNAQELSEYLVNTLLPTAMNDVKTAYLSLDTESKSLQIDLRLSYIDGPNGTLGFAQYSYLGNSARTPVESSFFIKIDTADFTDSNALTGEDRNDLLKSTVYHELTHSLMQYTMSKGMASDFPTWFKEGVAQLSGGGFATGWNTGLKYAADGITDVNDASGDDDFKRYLQSASVDSRPYGHGYLASAYIGQLASGQTEVNAANILSGINEILGDIKNNGKTLEQAVHDKTGKSLDEIKNAIDGKNDDAVVFVRKLSKSVGSGAGSIVYAGGLSAGTQVMGSLPADGSSSSEMLAANTIALQVGAEANTHIDVNLYSIGTNSLGLTTTNTLTVDAANDAIDEAKSALQIVSTIRSYYGAIQNRLEHTINNIDNVVENTTAAESQIRDTDMATSMVEYANLQVLLQAGQSMLATANQTNQGVLSLLQ